MSEDHADYRQRIAAVIVGALRDDEVIRAVGEGGAAARGRADRFSDLDLVIVAPLAHADAIFARVEAAMAAVTRITHVWRVEPPGFAGMAQRFYFLGGAPRFFAVDCSVMSPEGVVPFMERERHGEAVVWFDHDGALRPRVCDSGSLAQRRAHRLGQLRGATPVYSMLVAKGLARGRALEAYGFYQLLLGALIELLGMQHRPERFDFGWRYVETELPSAAQSLIARHAFVADEDALDHLTTSLEREINALLAQLSTPQHAH